jgi:hypothetical protein
MGDLRDGFHRLFHCRRILTSGELTMTNTEQPGLDAGALVLAKHAGFVAPQHWHKRLARDVVAAYLAALPKPTDEFARGVGPKTVEQRLAHQQGVEAGKESAHVFRDALSPAPDTVGVPREAFDAIWSAALDEASMYLETQAVPGYAAEVKRLRPTEKQLRALLATPLQLDEDRSFAAEIEALTWYAEQVAGCRKVTSEGNDARRALDQDGGKRATDALSALSKRAGEREGDSGKESQ